MNNIVEIIREEVLKRSELYKAKYGFDFWNDHIKYVVKNAIELAKKYGADVEIVELGALLHDISMPSEIGQRDGHNVYGAQIADELLTNLNYPSDRKERVKECILRHRGIDKWPIRNVEEQCVADADVIAHFDCIPSLFHLAFGTKEMNKSLEDGTDFVKKKLERDFGKLSDRSKKELKNRYENIMSVLFVDNK